MIGLTERKRRILSAVKDALFDLWKASQVHDFNVARTFLYAASENFTDALILASPDAEKFIELYSDEYEGE